MNRAPMTQPTAATARSGLALFAALLTVTPNLALASQPGSEAAQADASAERRRAEEAFEDQRYDDAAAAFERAYQTAAHPTDLFNLGRVREEQGDLEAALEHYESFAAQPRLSLAQRDAAAERIEVLRKLVQPEPPAPNPVVVAPSPSADQSTAKPDAGRPLIITGAVLAGVGALAAVGGGVGFGLVARKNTEDLDRLSSGENPSRLTLAQSEELHADGRNAEALQITFLAAGSTVALIGVGLVIAGARARQRDRRASVTPSAGPGFAGISTRWSF